jgi:hypothetical protein
MRVDFAIHNAFLAQAIFQKTSFPFGFTPTAKSGETTMLDIDTTGLELIQIQNCFHGGPGKNPIHFQVWYFRRPNGEIVLTTRAEDQKHLDAMRKRGR